MSCSEVLSPRPVRPWMPIPSTSPPPYEEPFEDYEEPGPSPSPYQASYHNSYHPSPRAGPSMLREPTVAADYPYNSRPHSRNSVHSRDPPQPSAFAASAYASRARAERNSSDVSIDHLREALNSLDSKMASLLNERDILESRLERAVRLHSPVHRLPSELLASIFTMGVMSIEEDDSLLLTTLMLVCRHWKEVALGTPLLWSRIVTGIHRPLSKAFRKLERSKSIPLHICVDFDPKVDNGTVTTDSIMRTMDLLRTSIWRWKSFRLTVPDRPQALAALMRCKDPAPLLEVLSIRVLRSIQEDHHHANPPRPIFQGQTPSLTSCSLTAFNFGWDMHLVSRLRVLKLGGYWNGYSPSVDTTLAILRACPHLEELVLRNMSDIESGTCQDIEPDPSDYGERIPDAKMVQLPRLVKASFHYSGSLRTRAVLALMSCPALEDIELCFLDNVSPMIEHLRRQSLTFLPLRRLRIESSFFSELKLAKFLRRVPSLASLELVDVEDASPSFLKNLASPPTMQTWVCPKLTKLSLEGCTALDWETIRSVVESRLPAHSKAYSRPTFSTTAPSAAKPISSASASASSSASAAAAAASYRLSTTSTSSASAFAAKAHILSRAPVSTASTGGASASLGAPQRLQSVDLTRCHQVSKEMIQWLRMYVADVKCDTVKGIWGDSTL